jgi:hypothetical protein
MEKDRQFGVHFDAVTSQGSHRSRLSALAHKVPNLLTFVNVKRKNRKEKTLNCTLGRTAQESGVKTSIHYSTK